MEEYWQSNPNWSKENLSILILLETIKLAMNSGKGSQNNLQKLTSTVLSISLKAGCPDRLI